MAAFNDSVEEIAMVLLVALSVPIAIGVYTVIQYNNDQAIAQENRRQDLEIANQTRLNDLAIAASNRQVDLQIAADVRTKDILLADDQHKENILVEYHNFLGNLLITDGVLLNVNWPVRYVTRYKTLTTLAQLNLARKIILIRSLHEGDLIIRRTYDPPFISLSSADLTGLDFSSTTKLDYRCLALEEVILNNVSFHHMNLDGATFLRSELNNANFAYSTCPDQVNHCRDMADAGINFRNTKMYRAIFTKASYIKASFSVSTIIDEGNFDDFKCVSCDFRGTSLVRARFTRALFRGQESDFSGANIMETYLYATRFQNTQLSRANMTRANATRAEFDRCLFSEAILINCSLYEAMIIQSNMTTVNLTGSDLTNANLTEVEFASTIMRHVNMSDVFSNKCNFQRAYFSGSNLRNGLFIENDFTNTTITDEQLASAKSLRGSILPDGTVVPMNE